MLPDDFDLASVRCNPAMGPPDNYPRGGFSRFDGGKRNIPVEGPKFQDKAFLRNGDRSWENKPVDRQEEDRRGVTLFFLNLLLPWEENSGGFQVFLPSDTYCLPQQKNEFLIK
jgi:hypothetical protein